MTLKPIISRPLGLILLAALPVIGFAQPTLDNISPASAPIGATVTITGMGLDPTPANNVVSFTNPAGGTTQAPGVSVAGNQLTVVVPSKAGDGIVTMKVNGVTATGTVSFTAVAPIIAGYMAHGKDGSLACVPGESLIIHGQYFDPDKTMDVVKLNGTQVTVTSYQATPPNGPDFKGDLTVTVPSNISLGAVSVTISLGNGKSAVGLSLTATNPPTVTAVQVTTKQDKGSSVPVTITSSTAQTAQVRYRSVTAGSSAAFTTGDATPGSGSTFDFTIPSAALSELGVEFKISVIDQFGFKNSDSATMKHVLINYPDNGLDLKSYVGAGNSNDQSSYRIISNPLVLKSPSVNGIFNDVLGGISPDAYRIFSYNGSSLHELTASETLDPGVGYWFIAASSSPLHTGEGTQVDVTTAAPFSIQLAPGWNLIGNPYNFEISWADVKAANPSVTGIDGNNSLVRTFRGTKGNSDVLRATEGGFVKNVGSGTVTVNIPVYKNPSIQGNRAGAPPPRMTNSLDQPAWEVMFHLVAGKEEDNLGGFGMNPKASESADAFDDFTTPRFMDYLEIVYDKKFANMTFTKDVIPTADSHVWNFEVASNLEEQDTRLSWDNSYFGNHAELVLLDLATFRAIDMRRESEYRFNRSVSKNFKVVFGNHAFIESQIAPDRLVLAAAYPNPFAGKIGFDAAVPANHGDATLEVIDMNGMRIASATLGAAPGLYHWEWDSDGKGAGLYIVRLRAGIQQVSQKVLKK